ncbi:MAG: hypothetical protein AB7L13_15310 [Acidimicrobiia bacterium]
MTPAEVAGILAPAVTDRGVVFQLIAVVLLGIVVGVAVRRERSAVLFVVGVATFLVSLIALRTVH